jgi:hypothetical protein
MTRIFRTRFFDSHSDNRKSKTCPELCRRIKNRKWAGFFCNRRRTHGVRGEGRGAAAKKVLRIGYLSSSEPGRESTRSEAIRLALRELGHIEVEIKAS